MDKPVWERDIPDEPGVTRYMFGYLDYLTWQSRCIRLLPEMSEEDMLVKNMYFAQGTIIANEELLDPMTGYVESKGDGLRPIQVYMDKEPWRSYASLMYVPGSKGYSPRTFETVASLIDKEVLGIRSRFELEVIGMSSDQAKVLQWRRAKVPLPAAYLEEKELVKAVQKSIEVAEEYGGLLRSIAREIARDILAGSDERTPDRSNVNNLAKSFDIAKDYWGSLEIPFYSLVEDLADDFLVKDGSNRGTMLRNWAESTVRRSAHRAFKELSRNLNTSARNLRAVAKGEWRFYGESKALMSLHIGAGVI
jgi:CRISPR system Cascade subunit CasA